MCASRAALGRGLDVDLRLSAKQGEALRGRLDVRTKCRPGKVLAISTVTDRYRSGIDVRLKRDLAAMTTAIDLHSALLLSHTIGCRAFWTRASSSFLLGRKFDAQGWHLDLSTEGSDYMVRNSAGQPSVVRPAQPGSEEYWGGSGTRPRLVPFFAD